MPAAGQWDEHVAALMNQQFAVDAPVALPREAPYPLAALAAVRSPVKALGLEEVAVGAVQLPPSSGSTAVDGFVFSRTGHAWFLGDAGENVKGEPFILVLTGQAEGLLQLHLGGHSAGVTFIVHPLKGERVARVQPAHLPHLCAELVEGGGGVQAGDEEVPGRRGHTGLTREHI